MNVVVRDSSGAERRSGLAVRTSAPTSPTATGNLASTSAARRKTIAAALADYAAVGFRHPIFVFRSPWDLETIEHLGEIRDELVRLDRLTAQLETPPSGRRC